MATPHTAGELRYIAGVLDALNATGPSDIIGFDGGLQLYWCDRVMGEVALDDKSNLSSWIYKPAEPKSAVKASQ